MTVISRSVFSSSIAFLVSSIAFALTHSNSSAQASPGTFRPKQLAQFRVMSLQLTNRDRKQHNRTVLITDPQLNQAAQLHAEDMLTRNFFSHTCPDGTTPTQRYRAVGGQGMASENLIVWQDPQLKRIDFQMLNFFQNQWMKSRGHQRNLLDRKSRRYGYGLAFSRHTKKIYAVQMFAIE